MPACDDDHHKTLAVRLDDITAAKATHIAEGLGLPVEDLLSTLLARVLEDACRDINDAPEQWSSQ